MLDDLDAEIAQLEREQFAGQLDEDGNVIEPLEDDSKKKKEDLVDEDDEIIDEEIEPSEELDDSEEEVDDLSDEEPDAEEIDDEGSEDEEELEEDEEDKPKRKSWKSEYEQLDLRYKNLRSATDGKLFTLRTQVANLTTLNTQLEEQITELQNQLAAVNANVDIYADIFTEEDVDVLGEDAIRAFKKANAKAIEVATAPLRNQLEAARRNGIKEKKQTADYERQQAYNIFLDNLKRLVPDFETLNYDAGFKQYMEGYDPDSTKSRKEELGDAAATGNHRWAATFFNGYKRLKSKPKKALEKKALPKSRNASVVDTSDKRKKTYPIAEVEKFYDDLTKGKYNKTEKLRELGEKLEHIYDKAYAEGRVIA